MDELKPCPFCGKKAELIDCEIHPRWYVKCSYRYCGVEQGHTYVDKKSAINAWNRRVNEQVCGAKMEEEE